MGGSAIGGTLAAAAVGRAGAPADPVLASYSLPRMGGREPLRAAVELLGDTEETLAAYDDAAARGARRIVCTTGGELAERARRDGLPVIPVPGGFQPRAAVGYSTVVALEVARLCGAAPDLRADVESAAVRSRPRRARGPRTPPIPCRPRRSPGRCTTRCR
jgi:glucose/mannose-6-phosphate isomerase